MKPPPPHSPEVGVCCSKLEPSCHLLGRSAVASPLRESPEGHLRVTASAWTQVWSRSSLQITKSLSSPRGSPGFLRILPGKARDQSTVLFTRSDVSMEVRAHGDAFPQSRGSAAPQRVVGGVRPFCTIITTQFAELKTHSRASAPSTDGKGFVPVLNIYTIFIYNVTLFITVLCPFLIRTRSNLVRKIKVEETGPAIHTAVRVSTRSVRGLVSGAPQERLCLNRVDRLRSLSAPGGVDTGWAERRTRRIGPGARPGGLRPVCRRYAQKQAENKTAGQEPREGRARAWRRRGRLVPHGGGAECWSSEIWVFEVRLALVSCRWLPPCSPPSMARPLGCGQGSRIVFALTFGPAPVPQKDTAYVMCWTARGRGNSGTWLSSQGSFTVMMKSDPD